MITNAVELDIEVLTLVVIIVLSFIGSLAKDYIGLFQFNSKIKFSRIILSTVTSSIFVFCIETYVINLLGFRGIVAISFLGGLAGFEILERISSLQGVVNLLKLIFLQHSDIRDYEDVLSKADKENKNVKIIIYDKSKDKSEELGIKKEDLQKEKSNRKT